MAKPTNGFLYFFPGVQAKPPAALVAECGLADVFDGPSFTDPQLGPNSLRGVICTRGACPGGLENAYRPDRQTWVECASGKFWLGWYTDNRPKPADLIKDDAVGGFPFPLSASDDARWFIPIAHAIEGRTIPLPRSIGLDRDGKRIFAILPKYERLLAYAETLFRGFRWATFHEGDEADLPADQEQVVWEAVVYALSTNYAVSQWEVAALGLFTVRGESDIALAAQILCDFPSYIVMRQELAEAAKKNGQSASPVVLNISDGEIASVLDSSQPSPTLQCSESK